MLKQLIEVFKAYAMSIGLPDWIANDVVFALLLSGLLITVACKIYQGIGAIILFKNQMILKRDLAPYNYALSDVRRATKYYIPTRYQNVSPAEDEEPGRNYIASAKNKLIPLFLKEVFPLSRGDNKYYLILADTGMGKTTFLINLYLAYKTRINLPFSAREFDIKLYPVWHPNTFADIEAIADKANTILLLDAFDEDVQAVENYKQRLSELLAIVNRFRLVVLTCRTQFFPSQKEEPHETGYFTGGEKGEYFFQKLYLSTFSMKDIRRYLKKRYSLVFHFGRYRKAKKIISACPNLVVRPMLLYYVDDLLKIAKEVPYAYQIYDQLIAEWIRRESTKYSTRKKYQEMQLFGVALRNFSQQLAIDLYEKRTERNGYFLPANTDFAAGILKMSELEHENLFDKRDAKSKSLLNRNAVGDYKFSHKSILEYFLAREMFLRPAFFEKFDFKGMDAAKRFLMEMVIHKIQDEKGHYFIGERKREFSSLNIEVVGQVEKLTFESIAISPVFLSGFDKMSSLVYKNTYEIGSFIRFRYAIFYLSATTKTVLSLIDKIDIARMPNIEGRLQAYRVRNHIANLISVLINIKQEVLPFGNLFKLIDKGKFFYLRKIFGFNESYERLPVLITSMIATIDQCVGLLKTHEYKSAKKHMPYIAETVAYFKDWLDQWRLEDDSLNKVFANKGFPIETIFAGGPAIGDKVVLNKQIKGEDKTSILEGLLRDIAELEAFFSHLEQFALKVPGCDINFEFSQVAGRGNIAGKGNGLVKSVIISWNLFGMSKFTVGRKGYWAYSTTEGSKTFTPY